MSGAGFTLVLEPDPRAASDLSELLFRQGIECVVADSGDAAWQALAARRPDLVLLNLATPALELFHRRLRDEYLGVRPSLIGLVQTDELAPAVADLDLDGVLLRPVQSGALLAALVDSTPHRRSASDSSGARRHLATVTLDTGRLREMLKLSCLGNELGASLDALAHRLALIYGVPGCAVLATACERQWIGAAGPVVARAATDDDWAVLWQRCAEAVYAGAPLLVETAPPSPDGRLHTETRLAVPVPAPGGELLGAICLFGDAPALFTDEARDALTDLAGRLGTELAWRSVHDRLAAERDHLRETAMLDPMLGVLSRATLEQAIVYELARLEQTGGPLAVAVIDVIGLRHINDHHGHVAGDIVLKHVADTARHLVRPHDIVGRSGDDEIAVVLGSTALPAAAALLERIRRALDAAPCRIEDGDAIDITVGIGVTEYSGPDDDGVALLARAARTAVTAGRRGTAIAIADKAPSDEQTRPDVLFDRYEAGSTLGGMYQIVHEISRGAMGVVYRAEDLGLSRPVALKMLRPDLTRDDEVVRRFREEAGILASIRHDNLVQVYSLIEERDDVFFVMELVEGVSLDSLIANLAEHEQFISLERTAAIVSQIAGALDAMHLAGVMHRDVKPGNVLLDRTRDRAVLVDVGLARRLGDRSEPAGTPGYIAPESVRGDPESPATDVYGLAATTYAVLTARAPFGRADDYREILRRQLEDPPRPPSAWRSGLSQAVDRVIVRGLAVDVRDRYASAGDLSRALEEALGASPPPAPLPQPRKIITQRGPALPPAPGRPDSRASNLSLAPDSNLRGPQTPLTRGAVFRSVGRVLGLRALPSWLQAVERDNQALADALSLRTAPGSWLPADLFHQLFDHVASTGKSPQVFARELGARAVEQSFQRFYPSSIESLSPRSTLSAIDILWRRYHSWGALAADVSQERSATVRYQGPPAVTTCAFCEGWLEQVVRLSGGAIRMWSTCAACRAATPSAHSRRTGRLARPRPTTGEPAGPDDPRGRTLHEAGLPTSLDSQDSANF